MEAVEWNRYRCQRDNPSFSSTLLDKIYRSIGERDEEESVVYRETMRKRQSIDGGFQVDKQNLGRVRRSGGSKNNSELVVRRKSTVGFESGGNSFYFNPNLGSSGSRNRVGFSSEDAETIYGFPARPRPIRTNTEDVDECREEHSSKYAQKHQRDDLQPKAKREEKFVKKKSRAMKFYGYLKKGDQPISPGARIATFLISLFTTKNAKKSSCTGGDDDAVIHTNRISQSANVTLPSSASSVSRSCLSKTPSSSSGKLTTDMKRCVRFYPGDVIADEYRQLRGFKSLHGDGSDSLAAKFDRNSINEEPKKHLTEKNHHIEETTRNFLKNYQKKVKYVLDSVKSNVIDNEEDYDDDDDSSASYASSDLFELDHLPAIGIDRRMRELPLYETTSIAANRAIANGLLV